MADRGRVLAKSGTRDGSPSIAFASRHKCSRHDAAPRLEQKVPMTRHDNSRHDQCLAASAEVKTLKQPILVSNIAKKPSQSFQP